MNRYLFLLIILIATTASQSFAHKLPKQTREQLDAISQRMFARGDDYFILVKAISDGIIRTGEDCYFSYDKGIVSFNHKKLKGKLQAQYNSYMSYFLATLQLRDPATASIFLSRDPFTLNEVLDTNSSFYIHPGRRHTFREMLTYLDSMKHS